MAALTALLIFAGTYAVVAVGRVPGLRLDRTGASLLGASLMVASGTLSLDEAFRAVDLGTLTLLLGMMIIVANLRLSGFFGLAAAAVARRAGSPLRLLAGVVAVSGILSAVLVNDTVCLMLTPLVVEAARRLKRNPVPYVLAVAMASNIGSTATITGNPQNMLIGSFSHIPYGAFAAALAPVAAIGLGLATAMIALRYPGEFRRGMALPAIDLRPRWNGAILGKTLLVTGGVVVAFFLGAPPAAAAILGGALLLPTRRLKPERIYREIDWPLLLLFTGLFIVIAGLEKAVLTAPLRTDIAALGLDRLPVLAVVTALLSNLVSNVPAVLALKPFVADLANAHQAWLALAMASTLAGNFTVLGSIANLITVEQARRHGVTVGFWGYFAVGAPLTVSTIAVGVLLLG